MERNQVLVPPSWNTVDESGMVGRHVLRSDPKKKMSAVGIITSCKVYDAKGVQGDPTLKRCLKCFESTRDTDSTVLICDNCDAEVKLECAGFKSVPKGDFFCFLCKEKKRMTLETIRWMKVTMMVTLE